MKKTKNNLYILLFCIIGCLTSSCGGSNSSDDPTPDVPTNISLSKNAVTLTCGEAESIDVSGVNATECDIKVDDDFVAYTSTNKNSINIKTKHVGKTKITLSYNGKSSTIDVEVKPTLNLIGNPSVLFDENWDTVKNANMGSQITEYDSRFDITEKTDYLTITHRYLFSSNKLKNILTKSYHGQQTNKYQSEYRSIMTEYATFQEDYNSTAFGGKIIIYNRNNQYLIGIRTFEGNDKGWYIYYAKTREEIIEKLSVNSSISL